MARLEFYVFLTLEDNSTGQFGPDLRLVKQRRPNEDGGIS
jgi:hypothetical protein